MKQKRIISILLAFSMVFTMLLNSALPVFATDIEIGEGSTWEGADTVLDGSIASGSCGDNITWRLDHTGTLTISGTGAMENYTIAYDPATNENVGDAPWLVYSEYITDVVIKSGVTTIGSYAFYMCTSLESVTIPDSVTSIEKFAFDGCYSLERVYYNGTEEQWEAISVYECNEEMTSATIICLAEEYTVNTICYIETESGGYESHSSGNTSFTVKGGEKITEPEITDIPEGYSLYPRGWNTINYYWDFENDVVTDDMTLVMWIRRDRTMTFDTLGRCEAPEPVAMPCYTYLYENIASLPQGETEDGYCLQAWYYEPEYITPVTLETDYVHADVTVYAKWAQLHSTATDLPGDVRYDVTIQYYSEYDNETHVISEMTVNELRQLAEPEIDIPEGYHQDIYGWQYYGYDDEGNYVSGTWDFENDTVNADITIYTSVYPYRTITFDTLGKCDTPAAVTVPTYGLLGDYIDTLPTGESEDGYCLAAWYYDTAYTNPVTLELDRLSSDVTVYPLWAQLHATASDLPTEEDIIAEGECGDNGDNVIWTLCADGELIISGTGAMADVSGNWWNAYSDDITKVTVKNGVTKISMQAFSGMTNLKEVSLPDTLTWIREFAFNGCESLEKINIPSNVKTMEWFIFDGCTMLKTAGPVGSGCNIEFGWDKEIPAKAFQHSNASLNSVIIPYGIEKIGDEAFFSCMNITEITLPETVTSIGFNAFGACNNLKTVNLPSSLEELGAQAFWGFSQIESIVIPDGITEIKDMTFQLCETLKEITIPASVMTIGNAAFDGAASLTDVYYTGTEAQWNSMSIGSSNESLTNATIHYGMEDPEYTVTIEYGVEEDVLNNYSNITLDTLTVKHGEKIEEPVLEVPEGYSMNPHGWNYYGTDDDGNSISGSWDFNTDTVFEDITIAILISKDRTVTFDTLGGCEAPAHVTVPKHGMLISLPTGESEDGYCLSAWYYEPEYIRPVTLEYDEIFEDTTIYAKWEQLHATASDLPSDNTYDVTVQYYSEYDNETHVIYEMTVNEFSQLPEPELAIPEGYHQDIYGWQYYGYDDEGNYVSGTWDFEKDIVSADITIYTNVYPYRTITFDTLGRVDTPAAVTVPTYGLLGQYIETLPTGETEDGYCLKAWYYDTDYTNPVTLELDRLSSDVTVYAKWEQLHATASDLPGEDESETSGTCGDNLTWTFDEATGTLTISGTGAMWSPATESAKYEEYINAWNELDNTSIGITAIIIEEGVTDISSFAGLTKVKSIKMADSVTNTDEATFANCTSLQEVILSENLTYLGYNLFDSCTNLETIVLPDAVTSIMFEAFKDCTNLKEITIPENVSSIWESAFAGCTNLTTVYFGGNSEQWNSIRVDSNNDSLLNATIIFKSTEIEPTPTPTPEPETVSNGTCGDSLTWTLDSEGTLTVGGTGAMADYEYTVYGPWYEHEKDIRKVVIEEGVTSIGQYAFTYCSVLEEVIMADSVVTIGWGSFAYCPLLEEITIPDGVKEIEDVTFYECTSLKVVHIPESVVTIGVDSFRNCSALTDIYYGGSQLLWTATGFDENYPELENVTVHFAKENENITGTCGDNLTWTLDSEGTLTISGTGAMNTSVYDVYDIADIPWYDYRLGVNKIVIENGITNIDDYAFYNCSNLTQVTIGEDVTRIGEEAFRYCSSLETINIPETVADIGAAAFGSCTALRSVNYGGNEEQWNAIVVGEGNECLVEAEFTFAETPETRHTVVLVYPEFTSAVLMESEAVEETGENTYSVLYGEEVTIEVTSPSCYKDVRYLINGVDQFDNVLVVTEDVTVEIDFTVEHIEGAVSEENIIDATCSQPGSYEEVVRCEGCSEELYRQTISIPEIPHTEDTRYDDVVDPTCVEPGEYYETLYCTVCDTVFSSTLVEVPATGHTAGEIVVENEKAATCTANGSYDNVTYCEVCSEELSRTTETIEKTGHNYETVYYQPTCTTSGYYTMTCTYCGTSQSFNYADPLGHSYEAVVTPPTETEQGYTTYTCSTCGDSYVDSYTDPTGPSEEIEIEVENTASTAGATVAEPEGGWTEGENTFTVSAEKPCVVVVSYDGGRTYTRVTATATGTDGTYSFTADITAGAQVAVVTGGDVNNDGKMSGSDITRLKAAFRGKTSLDGLQSVIGDTNGDGKITGSDITKLKAAFRGKTNLSW
ncbi:MAG: leucine-rich repeat protein [Oscillospiraceae bacterium]|nr:leucine-rich repeat protein [Oscillospiraceae bacterium]